MAVSSLLALRAEGVDSGRTLSVDLARRVVRVAGAGEALGAIDLGLLQTAPTWGSITGRLRDAKNGQEPGFVLIVDRSLGRATLEIDGRPTRVFTLAP